MALPTLQRKLFQNDGYGPLLKDEIVSKHISVQDWSNAYDYPVATVARGSDGVLYYSKLQSGPGTGAGAVDPTTDDGTYWTAPKVPTMPLADSSKALANTEWVGLWYNSHILADTYYLDAVNGNDANDGLTAGTAKKTYAAFYDFVSQPQNIFPRTITLNLADGIYDEYFICPENMNLVLHGNSRNTKITDRVGTIGSSQFMSLSGTFSLINKGWIGVQNGGMDLLDGLVIYFDNVSIGTGIRVTAGGVITKHDNDVITLVFTNCNFPYGTVASYNGGLFALGQGGRNISGNVTGKRFVCYNCGGIFQTYSTTLFPGTVAGTVDSTSYYS